MKAFCAITLVLLALVLFCSGCTRLDNCAPHCTRIPDRCVVIPEMQVPINIGSNVETINILGSNNISKAVLHTQSLVQCLKLHRLYPNLNLVFNKTDCIDDTTSTLPSSPSRPSSTTSPQVSPTTVPTTRNATNTGSTPVLNTLADTHGSTVTPTHVYRTSVESHDGTPQLPTGAPSPNTADHSAAAIHDANTSTPQPLQAPQTVTDGMATDENYKYALISLSAVCGLSLTAFVSIKIYIRVKIKVKFRNESKTRRKLMDLPSFELSSIAFPPSVSTLTSTPRSHDDTPGPALHVSIDPDALPHPVAYTSTEDEGNIQDTVIASVHAPIPCPVSSRTRSKDI